MGWRVSFWIAPVIRPLWPLDCILHSERGLPRIPEWCLAFLDGGPSTGHEMHNKKNKADDEHHVE